MADTDSDLSDISPPQNAPVTPPAPPATSLTAHFGLLQDALTKEPVTSATDLTPLYEFGGQSVDNTLLSNVTDISNPKVRCCLVIANGKQYPPSDVEGKYGYDLYFRFNNLFFAPTVRLECSFPSHTLILEWHFNDCEGKQLSDFTWSQQDTEGSYDLVTFKAKGATCEGFNNVAKSVSTFNEAQKAIYDVLRALIDAPDSERLRLHLKIADLSAGGLEELNKLRGLLPGGDQPLLSSIGVDEYSCFPSDVDDVRAELWKPYRLINRACPPPMVALRAGDTCSSIKEFTVQHMISTSMQHWEGETTLREFSRRKHKVTLYKSGEFVVIAMNFGEMPNFGSRMRPSKLRLPNELEIDVEFSVPGMGIRAFKAHLESGPLGLPDHDAFFVVAKQSPSSFGDNINDPTVRVPWRSEVLELTPHYNSFLFNSQMEALEVFPSPAFDQWHNIVRNQLHTLPEVDVTRGLNVEPHKLAEALNWLRECKPWNPGQLRVIDSIHKAKGRLSLCSGIAGSGKTTLQMAISIFCVKLGGKAIVTGTANTNADATVNGIEEFEEVVAEKKLRVYRIYTGARKVRLQDISTQQAQQRLAGHQGGNVSSLNTVRFEALARKEEKIGAMHCSLTQGVLDEAEKGELVWPCQLRYRGSPSTTVDAWAVFRECLKSDGEGEFKWNDDSSYQRYNASFEQCKRHLLSLADIIVCTNGNIRCGEIETFAKENRKKNIKFFAVLSDETAKEVEINLINSITAPFPRTPDLYVFFGDERQLGPINTCSKEPFEFNPYNQRLDTSLFSRLIRQGFPHVQLTVQERMHPCLSKFPSNEFYDGALTDALSVQRPLEAVKPGLTDVLHGIIASEFSSTTARERYLENATEEQARLHYIEMPVYNVKTDVKKLSMAIPEHIGVFFDQILPDLQTYFGAEMEQEVMVITAYSFTVKLYEIRMCDLRKQQDLPKQHYPKVLTIDAAQGQEATMVLMDGAMQFSNLPPHMADRGRSNAAMTRARECFWILGGPLQTSSEYNDYLASSPFVELKRELEETNQVHRFTPRKEYDDAEMEKVFRIGKGRVSSRGRGGGGFGGGGRSRRPRVFRNF